MAWPSVAPGDTNCKAQLSHQVALKRVHNNTDLDIGLVHAPTGADWALVLAKDFLQQGQKPDCPAIDRGMVDKHAAFFHDFLKMAVAERISRIPTDVYQNHVDWESHSFGRQHRVEAFSVKAPQHRRASCLTANATEPANLPSVTRPRQITFISGHETQPDWLTEAA